MENNHQISSDIRVNGVDKQNNMVNYLALMQRLGYALYLLWVATSLGNKGCYPYISLGDIETIKIFILKLKRGQVPKKM